MRSIPFTLLLLLATVAVCLTAALRLSEGSLDRMFGSRATGLGEYLYHFETKDIYRIRLSGNGVKAECVFEKGMWRIVKPWDDRMDPRAADAILQFTLGTRVEDIIPEGKLDTAKAKLREGTIGVRIENRRGEELATYLLGRKTEWIHRDPKTGEETPTVFIQPLDAGHKGYIYACTGDIHPIFKDGLRHLRDHHPFLFNPYALEAIRIHDSEGERVLSRAEPKGAWRITKPLELRTDPAAVKKLIEDLFKLRAVKVADRDEVTLPAEGTNGKKRISLRHFGETEETVLEILPPATPDADTTFATVNTRPGTVFELRLKPLAPGLTEDGTPEAEADVVSLAGLPDTVNELRNQMLTNLDPNALEGILISPATSGEIVVARKKDEEWKYQKDGRMEPINPMALARMIRALTSTKVAGFVSDAAVNLAPYGLDRPALKLTLVSFGSDRVEFSFGQSRDGTWHAMRTGVPTVMKLDDEFIREISTQPWQWRHPSIWSIADVDLLGIERSIEGRPPLILEYQSLVETWTARENGTDRSAELDTNRADRLLKLLLELQCETWVSPDDAAARTALARPALSFSLAVKTYDAEGKLAGVAPRVLMLAPASDRPDNAVFYGRIDRDPNPFILGADTVRLLAVDLFGD